MSLWNSGSVCVPRRGVAPQQVGLPAGGAPVGRRGSPGRRRPGARQARRTRGSYLRKVQRKVSSSGGYVERRSDPAHGQDRQAADEPGDDREDAEQQDACASIIVAVHRAVRAPSRTTGRSWRCRPPRGTAPRARPRATTATSRRMLQRLTAPRRPACLRRRRRAARVRNARPAASWVKPPGVVGLDGARLGDEHACQLRTVVSGRSRAADARVVSVLVGIDDRVGVAVHDDLAVLEPDGAGAGLADDAESVADEEHGAGLARATRGCAARCGDGTSRHRWPALRRSAGCPGRGRRRWRSAAGHPCRRSRCSSAGARTRRCRRTRRSRRTPRRSRPGSCRWPGSRARCSARRTSRPSSRPTPRAETPGRASTPRPATAPSARRSARSSVDLPDPFGPIRPIASPR